MPELSAEALGDLRRRIDGSVTTPADPAYEAERLTWNRAVDQRPAVIVTVTSANDVVEAVRFAREQGLGVAVQATGHGTARPANGALLILTRAMSEVIIDPEAQTARIEAGVQWGQVLEMAQVYGLAPLLGSSPGVGAIGYTLGGGVGWLARKYGLGVDSVLNFEVVTAEGDFVVASALERPDLFWALRGGGGANFAIVTAMEVRLYPVSTVYAGSLLYPADQAREVFQRYREWIADLPDEMTSSVLIMNYPPFEMVPEPVRGKSFALVRGCYAGDVEVGKALVDSWRAWKTPALDAFGPMPFAAAGSISQDPRDPIPGYNSGAFVSDLCDDAIDAILAHSLPQNGPPPVIKIEVHHGGGAIARVHRQDAAVSHREATLLLHLVAMTPGPEAFQAAERHAASLLGALAPVLLDASYPNFLDGGDQVQRIRQLYEADKVPVLRAVKEAYDPDNLLRYGFGVPGE